MNNTERVKSPNSTAVPHFFVGVLEVSKTTYYTLGSLALASLARVSLTSLRKFLKFF